MYAVSKGPATTRIINSRTRRDISLKLENLDVNRELRRKNSGGSDDSSGSNMSNSPKPTFNTNVTSKSSRNSKNQSGAHHDRSPPPTLISPAHRELANFLSSTWAVVQKELDSLEKQKHSGQQDRGASYKIRRYEEKEPHPIMRDFKAFEMEAFWARQLYTKLTAGLAADT